MHVQAIELELLELWSAVEKELAANREALATQQRSLEDAAGAEETRTADNAGATGKNDARGLGGRRLSFCEGWRSMCDGWGVLCRGDERRAFRILLMIAAFNQLSASTAIINYGPRVLEVVGVRDHGTAIILSSSSAGMKLAGICVSLVLIDCLGRRPLLIGGGVAMCCAMFMLSGAVALESPDLTIASILCYVCAMSTTWASGGLCPPALSVAAPRDAPGRTELRLAHCHATPRGP